MDMNTLTPPSFTTDTLSLRIAGMSCEACVHHVTRALEGTSGVVDVHVDLASSTAHLVVEPARVHVEDLILAVSHAGYAAHRADAPAKDGLDVPDLPDPYSRAGGCCRTRPGRPAGH